MIAHGTHQIGEKNGQAKLTEKEAREIFSMKGSLSQKEIGKIFGVSQGTVFLIHHKLMWAWIHKKEIANER